MRLNVSGAVCSVCSLSLIESGSALFSLYFIFFYLTGGGGEETCDGYGLTDSKEGKQSGSNIASWRQKNEKIHGRRTESGKQHDRE